MSDIRFNQWLHQSGTGGVTQLSTGHVGIGTTDPLIPVHAGNNAVLNVGVVTANSVYAGNFYGSGANLTSLPAQATIANNADNRVITGGSGVNLNGEAELTYSSPSLKLLSSGTAPQIRINSDTSDGSSTRLTIGRATGSNHFVNGASSGDSAITFGTNLLFGVGTSEKLRIDSSGRTLIGTSTQNNNAKLQVTTDQQVVATFEGTGVSDPQIYVGDNMASPTDNCIILGYDKADNRGYLTVGGDADSVFTVANGGNIGINQASPSDKLHVVGTTNFTGNSYIGGDLYMYGSSYTKGIFLGGSGSANKLDDYEEGTWTPSFNALSTGSVSVTSARYTKIGRMVFVQGYVTVNSTSGNTFEMSMPFAQVSAGIWAPLMTQVTMNNSDQVALRIHNGSTQTYMKDMADNDDAKSYNNLNGSLIIFSGSYEAQ